MVVLSLSDVKVPKCVPFVNVQCTGAPEEIRGDANESRGGYSGLQTGGSQTDLRSKQALLEGMEVNLILTNAKVGHILLTWTPYAGKLHSSVLYRCQAVRRQC